MLVMWQRRPEDDRWLEEREVVYQVAGLVRLSTNDNRPSLGRASTPGDIRGESSALG